MIIQQHKMVRLDEARGTSIILKSMLVSAILWSYGQSYESYDTRSNDRSPTVMVYISASRLSYVRVYFHFNPSGRDL